MAVNFQFTKGVGVSGENSHNHLWWTTSCPHFIPMILIHCAITHYMTELKRKRNPFAAKQGGCVLSHVFAGEGHKMDDSGSRG